MRIFSYLNLVEWIMWRSLLTIEFAATNQSLIIPAIIDPTVAAYPKLSSAISAD
ncbi:MAG: hypothetical protein AB4042_04495 [Leptolyngbyaceae cyanobacterium]